MRWWKRRSGHYGKATQTDTPEATVNDNPTEDTTMPRKPRPTTQTVVNAFMQRQVHAAVMTTETDGRHLTLFRNTIAEWRNDGLYITLAGHPTQTTCERLSMIPGVTVRTHSCLVHLNGQPWEGRWTRVLDIDGHAVPVQPDARPAEWVLGNVGRTKREQMRHDAIPVDHIERKAGHVLLT